MESLRELGTVMDGVNILSARVKYLIYQSNQLTLTVSDVVGSWTIIVGFKQFEKLDADLDRLFSRFSSQMIKCLSPFSHPSLIFLQWVIPAKLYESILKRHIDEYLNHLLSMPPFVSQCKAVVDFFLPQLTFSETFLDSHYASSTFQIPTNISMNGSILPTSPFITIKILTCDGDLLNVEFVEESNYFYFTSSVLEKIQMSGASVDPPTSYDSNLSTNASHIGVEETQILDNSWASEYFKIPNERIKLKFFFFIDEDAILVSDLDDLKCAIAFYGDQLILKTI